MRIISKFYDYYDVTQNLGTDPDLIYHRVSVDEIWERSRNESPFSPTLTSAISSGLDYRTFLIGFCGKIFVGVEISHQPKFGSTENHIFYDADSCIDFLEKHKKDLPQPRRTRYYRGYMVRNYYEDILFPFEFWDWQNETIRRFFDYNESEEIKEYMIERNIVCFSCVRHNSMKIKITINPMLCDFEFYKVRDPYTATQEISMYLGGVLGSKAAPMLEINDIDLIESKGFDKKWSFRKLPSKRKGNLK